MSQPFEDSGEKPSGKRPSYVNKSLTSKMPNPGMLGIDKRDFANDRSENYGRKSKSKKSEDAVFTSGSGSRPGSGGKSGARKGIKDEVRNELRTQKTLATAKKRQSLFVGIMPHSHAKKVNFADGLDLLDDGKDHSSDRIDESDEEVGADKANRLDLAGYNQKRKDKLKAFNFKKDHEDVIKEADLEEEVSKATAMQENGCTKNLVISLFWEEKIVLLIRMLQLYALIFVFYYEYWPSYARKFFTPYMMGVLLTNFHIPDQENYYLFM